MANKVLFLDIDGVMNSDLYLKKNQNLIGEDTDLSLIDPKAVHLMKVLLCSEQIDVVLSSTWREEVSIGRIESALKLPLKDITEPYLPKEQAILKYVLDHDLLYFAVIDDEWLFELRSSLNPHLVKTEGYRGLLPEHINLIKQVLNLKFRRQK